ncbi:hypothetical protein PVAND_015587 [Polypedilum vanderplanki]|uniref:Chitin-binding type-2 domain-containing protein n=1 Tax=Polypedilum vanderplanki TaxID=319348 RepID=A0A9J6BD08_POLVA|nr:hypothetical protein PVAND_015587 [Polypedilum vanderplanki]
MTKFQIIIFLLVFQWSQSSVIQNLCGEARDAGFLFANDPSRCDRYLFCVFNSDGSVLTTHQLTCDANFPVFFEDHCYAEGSRECTNCPELNRPILYATHGCKSFALCRGDGTLGAGICGENQNFDRSSGTCVPENFAPCVEVEENEPDCEGLDYEFIVVPGTDCTKFALCIAGEVKGKWECHDGSVFIPEKNNCGPRDDDFVCSDDEEILSSNNRNKSQNILKNIPRAPNFTPKYFNISKSNKN